MPGLSPFSSVMWRAVGREATLAKSWSSDNNGLWLDPSRLPSSTIGL